MKESVKIISGRIRDTKRVGRTLASVERVPWSPGGRIITRPPLLPNIDHYIHRILFSSLDYPLFSLRAHQKYVHLLLRWHGDAFYGVFLLFR